VHRNNEKKDKKCVFKEFIVYLIIADSKLKGRQAESENSTAAKKKLKGLD
jgi:hypothetical protein